MVWWDILPIQAPAKFLVLESLAVIVPYAGEPPVNNYDKMAASIEFKFSLNVILHYNLYT